MAIYGPDRSDCFVYVYREGALSAVGHDLQLRVTDFRIEFDPGAEPAVRAQFDAGSLRVVGVLKGGAVDEGGPGERDRREIESIIAREVLEAHRDPRITFHSKSVERAGDEACVVGRLELHGVDREIDVSVRLAEGRAAARVSIHQPVFGIKPYRALLGALRVKPEVIVEVIIPDEAV